MSRAIYRKNTTRALCSLAWVLVMALTGCGGGESGTTTASSTGSGGNPIPTGGCSRVDKWGLWTKGHMHGFNLFAEHANPSWETDGDLQFSYVQADLNDIASLGTQFVVLSHPGLFRMRPPYEVDTQAQASLDNLIDMAGKAGMYAVIAFRTGPGRNEYAFRYQKDYDPSFAQHLYEPLWDSSDAQTAFAAMVRYTAQRYKDSCVVIGIDPLVEPNYAALAEERTGQDLPAADFYKQYGGTVHDWNSMAARITAAVREVDTQMPLLLEPESYGSVDFLPYLTFTGDSHTVYTAHNYAPQEAYTHQSKTGQTTYPGLMDVNGTQTLVDRTWLSNWLKPLSDYKNKYQVPVAITETGIHRFVPGGLTYLSDEFDLLDAMGASYAMWEWRAASDAYNDFDIRLGTDPNNQTAIPGNSLYNLVKTRFSQ